MNTSVISNCYATGNVRGIEETGGLVGWNWCGTISNCYARGSVTGHWNTGGLVGDNYHATILNCYAAGNVSGTMSIGGLVGSNTGTIWASFWDVEATGQSSSPGGSGATGRTTLEMMTGTTFFGWGYTPAVWTIDEGNDYPHLAWEDKPGEPIVPTLSDFLDGEGTQEQPYMIYTAEQLNLIGLFLGDQNKHFQVANDIDLSLFTGTEFNTIRILRCEAF